MLHFGETGHMDSDGSRDRSACLAKLCWAGKLLKSHEKFICCISGCDVNTCGLSNLTRSGSLPCGKCLKNKELKEESWSFCSRQVFARGRAAGTKETRHQQTHREDSLLPCHITIPLLFILQFFFK